MFRRIWTRIAELPRGPWLVGLAVVAWLAVLAIAAVLWILISLFINFSFRPS